MTPVKDGVIGVELTEPGSDTLVSYYRICGDEIGSAGKSIDKKCIAGETVHFHWILAPNDKWADGNCPINIFWDIAQREDRRDISGTWGFINPYISPEHYDSANHTAIANHIAAQSNSTGNHTGNNTVTTDSSPGFSVLPAIIAFLLVVAIAGSYRWK